MSRENFKNWVCKAVEMEEKGKAFYEQAAKECTTQMGQKIFSMLRDDEIQHIQRIREIEKALDQDSGLEQACRMDDMGSDAGQAFRELAEKVKSEKPCDSTAKALNAGIDFELALVKFYEEALEKASEDLERDFLKRMIQEEKGHYVLLSDMQYYYEDPEGWAMGKARSGLDGA